MIIAACEAGDPDNAQRDAARRNAGSKRGKERQAHEMGGSARRSLPPAHAGLHMIMAG